MRHLPGYIEKLGQLKAKGVDVVAVIAGNDAWVMNAWGKANKVTSDDIVRFLPVPHATLLAARRTYLRLC